MQCCPGNFEVCRRDIRPDDALELLGQPYRQAADAATEFETMPVIAEGYTATLGGSLQTLQVCAPGLIEQFLVLPDSFSAIAVIDQHRPMRFGLTEVLPGGLDPGYHLGHFSGRCFGLDDLSPPIERDSTLGSPQE